MSAHTSSSSFFLREDGEFDESLFDSSCDSSCGEIDSSSEERDSPDGTVELGSGDEQDEDATTVAGKGSLV